MSKSSTSSTASSGVEFFELLCLLFIGLKLTGVIGWSWWWVLSPLWIQFVVIVPVAVIVLIIVLAKG